MAEIGEAFVVVRGDTSDAESKIGNIGKAIVGLAATKVAFDFISDGVERFGELEVATMRTNTVLGSTQNVANTSKDSIIKYADSVQDLTGANAALTIAAENVLLGFRNVRNEAGAGNDIFDQTRALVTDLSTALGVDATAAAKTLGKALQDPSKAAGVLRRANITLTESQKNLIAWFTASGDTLSAQKVVLEAVSQSVGGTALAYGQTLPAKLAVAQQAFLDIKGSIAGILAPAIEFAAGIVKDLADGFNDLDPGTQKLIAAILGIAAAFALASGPLEAFVSLLPALFSPVALVVLALAAVAAAAIYAYQNFEGFREVVDGVVTWFQDSAVPAIQNAAQGLVDWWRDNWPQIKQTIKDVVDWMQNVGLPAIVAFAQGIADAFVNVVVWFQNVGLPAIVAFFQAVGEQLSNFAQFFIERWDAIKEAVSNVLTVLIAIITAWIAAVVLAWNTFGEAIANQALAAWEFIKSIIQAALQFIAGYIDIVLGLLTLDFSRFWQGVQEIFQSWLTTISAVVTFAFETIKSYIIAVLAGITTAVQAAWALIQSVIAAAMSAITAVIQYAWALIQSVISAAMNAVLGVIQFAWAAITGLISAAMSTILGVIQFGWSAVVGAISAAMTAVLGAISAGFYAATNAVSSAMSTMVSAVNDGVTQILGLLVNLPGQAVSALGNLGSLLYGAGQALINGLLNGIKDAVSAVYNFVSGIAGKIASLKGPIEKDQRLLIPAGHAIMAGLGQGLDAGWNSVASQIAGYSPKIGGTVSVAAAGAAGVGGGGGGDSAGLLASIDRRLAQIAANQRSPGGRPPSSAILNGRR